MKHYESPFRNLTNIISYHNISFKVCVTILKIFKVESQELNLQDSECKIQLVEYSTQDAE